MRLLLATALALAVAAPAFAQPAAVTRVRGAIKAHNGPALVVKERSGEDVTVALTPDAAVTSVSTTTLAEVHPGSFIGTAAVPQPDGTLRALEVHIFPESMRGTGEGFRPWDLGPQSTMTNGTVGQISGSDGHTLTVKYKEGEKTVVVPPDVPIVSFEPGTRAQLAPGAHVVINAVKGPDGELSANRVSVGKDGLNPPM